MATWNGWYEGYECAVIIRAKDYGVVIKSLHCMLFLRYANIKLLCDIGKKWRLDSRQHRSLAASGPGCVRGSSPVGRAAGDRVAGRQAGPRARTSGRMRAQEHATNAARQAWAGHQLCAVLSGCMFASLYITRCPVDRETAKARKFSLGNLEISSNSNSVFSKETVI